MEREGFSLYAIVGSSIGANTAVFSATNAVLIRKLPVAAPAPTAAPVALGAAPSAPLGVAVPTPKPPPAPSSPRTLLDVDAPIV